MNTFQNGFNSNNFSGFSNFNNNTNQFNPEQYIYGTMDFVGRHKYAISGVLLAIPMLFLYLLSIGIGLIFGLWKD